MLAAPLITPLVVSVSSVKPPLALLAKIDAAAPGFDEDASAIVRFAVRFPPPESPSPLTPILIADRAIVLSMLCVVGYSTIICRSRGKGSRRIHRDCLI